MKTIFNRKGQVYIINSYDISADSDKVYQYWCLPLGMKNIDQMDIEVDSFVPIQAYDPSIVFLYPSSILFNIVEEIKKWDKLYDFAHINSSLLYHFIDEDYQVNSNIIECIIEVVYGKSVYICMDKIDNRDEYFIHFK